MGTHKKHIARAYQAGFSLIEVLAALLAFSIILITVGSIFVRMVAFQRRGFAAQKIQENSLYVLELMAREIRVSTIGPNQDNDCSSTPGTTLSMNHPVNGSVTYSLSPEGMVSRTVGGVEAYISSRDVKFTSLGFCINGSSRDQKQARIAIIATVENTEGLPAEKLTFHLETMVAAREIATELQ